MPRTSNAKAYRTLERIREKAENRARDIALEIVGEIATNPTTPYDDRERRESYNRGPHLKFSYYARQDPVTGDWLVKCRRRYWVFVEFGTKTHRAQPHVRPAIELVRAAHR